MLTPVSRKWSAPHGKCSSSRGSIQRSAAASSTFTASRVTSTPMPSPGSTATRCGLRSRGCCVTGGHGSTGSPTLRCGPLRFAAVESSTVLRLHIVPAQGAPFDHEVTVDRVVIGRSSSSDLPLADRFLSRHHARIVRDGDRYLVEDLGSRNGTLLNGSPVMAPTPLTPGEDRKSTRLNSSHGYISYAVFCLKK